MTIKELIDTYGLKEISTATRISNENLINLMNEEYELMSKTNALGFTKILEREYEIDLSSVVLKIKESAKDEDYIPKDLVLTERKYRDNRKFASGALIFMVLFVGLVYVVYLINSQNGGDSVSILPLQNEETAVVEVQPHNPFWEELTPQNEEMKEQGLLEQESSENTIEQEQENFVVNDIVEEVVVEVVEVVSAEEFIQDESIPQVIETFLVEEVVILPKRRAWLGYINLNTNERTQKNNANEMIIDEDNTIIVTGHGRMRVAGKEYNTGDRLFFHFVGGELKRLNESAFKELNGGRIW